MRYEILQKQSLCVKIRIQNKERYALYVKKGV